MTFARRAGSATLPDGRSVTWSLADGRRGRRWRTATRDPDGRLSEVLLLELDPAGRLSKLELATAAGLLTLHPEGDALHGNAVTESGVQHLRFPWDASSVIVVRGSPVTAAAIAARVLGGGVGEGPTSAVVVRPELLAVAGEARLERRGPTTVRIAMFGHERDVDVDADGIPAEFRGGADWPLEEG